MPESQSRRSESVPRAALTLEEAAESMGVSLSTFRRHVLPDVKTIRLGSCRLVSTPELAGWLDLNGTLSATYDHGGNHGSTAQA